jgi:SnoaL-like domain
MVDLGAVQSVLARWWVNYDEGRFGIWPELFTSDVHFTCRSDTGATEYEEFIRADVHGVDGVLEWQTEHRKGSPYPLRHNATNVHITATRSDEADFSSYLFVTQIFAGRVDALSTGAVSGTVRTEDGVPRLAALHVVLDTSNSEVFTARIAGAGPTSA